MARVGDEKILGSDLQKAFQEQSGDYGPDLLEHPEGGLAIRKNLLNGLIEEKLLEQAAKEKKIALTAAEEAALQNQLRSGYDEGRLNQILAQKRISLEEWTGRQRKRRLIQKLLDQEVYAGISPSPAQIEDAYRKNPRLFREPDRIHCRHMVTTKREKAEKILSLLKQGGNFASLATQYSESPDRERGGDLGYIGRGEVPRIFEQACFTLNTAQTSEIVPSEYGFHIFRVVDKRPGSQLTLKEATPAIIGHLKEIQGREALRLWLEGLHRSQEVRIDERALKKFSEGVQP